MPAEIDNTTEVEITNLITTVDIQQITKYLGLDPSLDNEFQPVDIEGLILDCLNEIEAVQYSIILQKEVTLTLPPKALCSLDGKIYLPYGKVPQIASVTFRDTAGADVVITDLTASGITLFSPYPASIWSENWSDSLPDIDTSYPYPITIKWTAGYEFPEEVPRATKVALRLACNYNFQSRGMEDVPVPSALTHHQAIDQKNNRRCMEYIT